MLTPSLKGSALAASFVFCMSTSAAAQSSPGLPAAAGDDAELAKKLSNPISDLVSVPFQFNWEQNVGPDRQTRFVLNVQPVMPFLLNPELNLIARVIVPFVSQPPLFVGGAAASGVSDILTSFFFSPDTGSTLTWGAGLPSTTEPTLGTEKWSAGPTIVVLRQAQLERDVIQEWPQTSPYSESRADPCRALPTLLRSKLRRMSAPSLSTREVGDRQGPPRRRAMDH
jgi:hypothetical protein